MESLRDLQSRSALFVVIGVLIGASITRVSMCLALKHTNTKEEKTK